jgi:mitofusin
MTSTSYRELSSTFGHLHLLVSEAINDMDAEINTLDEEMKQLEEAANSAEVLRNKANYIAEQLDAFDDEFFKLHN